MFILKQEVSEFIELYAGLKVGQDDNSTLMPSDVELNQVKIWPPSISWKSKGYVTSVKNQVCFHCYMYACTEYECMYIVCFFKFRVNVAPAIHSLLLVLWNQHMALSIVKKDLLFPTFPSNK